jgi:hypothetical protein
VANADDPGQHDMLHAAAFSAAIWFGPACGSDQQVAGFSRELDTSRSRWVELARFLRDRVENLFDIV